MKNNQNNITYRFKRLSILIVLLFLLGYSFLNAQTYRINKIDTENGLPQSSVKDIVKDKYGFIWLSTESGLVKLDGKNVLTINDNLVNKRMWKFFGNPGKDSIFIFDESEKNLYTIHQRKNTEIHHSIAKKYKFNRYFRNEKYFHYLINDFHYKNKTFTNFFIFTNDEYYYFNENHTYYHNEKLKKTLKINFNINSESFNELFVLNNKVYLLNSENKNIVVLEKGVISEVKIPKEFLYSDIEIYWSATNNQSFLFSKDILYEIKQGKKNLQLKPLIKIPEEINIEDLSSIFYDDDNKKIYIGSFISGLYIITLQNFTTIQDVSSFHKKSFYALLPYDKNTILAPNGKLFQKDGASKQLFTGGQSDKYSFLYDDEKNLHYKLLDELFIKNKNDNYKKTINKKFKRNISGLFYENGYYILSFEGDNGLTAFYKDNSFKKPVFTISTEDIVKSVKFLTEDSLLIGTASELYKFSVKTGNKILINKKPNFNIRTIYISKSKKIWILTYGSGFYLLENERLIPMPLDKKKNLLQTHCILEDKNGFFWMSSNHGLYKIKESILLKSKQKKTIPYYYFYDKTDGFITNEFNGGCNPCGNILEDSTFVFPSLQGIVTFRPNEPLSLYPNKEFYAERANINNKKNIYFNDKLVLERDFFRAEVFLDLAYYGNEVNLDIRAKLNTEDSEWENISN